MLVEPGDAAGLADALVRVLTDRGFAERLGRGALEDARALQWSPRRYAEALQDMVDRLLVD